MILVLLGTQNNSFHRLLEEIDKLINKKIINEEVIVQSGGTKYKSENMQIFDLIENSKLEELIDKADLIITHGGVGSIIMGLKKKKKIIAVPRLREYGEHVNNHQIQIVENFSKEGYIKGIVDLSLLGENIIDVKNNFSPKEFVSNTNNIIKVIENFIDNT